MVRLEIKNRQATVFVIPSASALVIKALNEPPRDKKKGNISFSVLHLWSFLLSSRFHDSFSHIIPLIKENKSPDLRLCFRHISHSFHLLLILGLLANCFIHTGRKQDKADPFFQCETDKLGLSFTGNSFVLDEVKQDWRPFRIIVTCTQK